MPEFCENDSQLLYWKLNFVDRKISIKIFYWLVGFCTRTGYHDEVQVGHHTCPPFCIVPMYSALPFLARNPCFYIRPPLTCARVCLSYYFSKSHLFDTSISLILQYDFQKNMIRIIFPMLKQSTKSPKLWTIFPSWILPHFYILFFFFK